jgi:hypothetical protein
MKEYVIHLVYILILILIFMGGTTYLVIEKNWNIFTYVAAFFCILVFADVKK